MPRRVRRRGSQQVKPTRERPCLRDRLIDLVREFFDDWHRSRRFRLEAPGEDFRGEGCPGELLAQAVVQLVPHAPLLVGAGFQDLALQAAPVRGVVEDAIEHEPVTGMELADREVKGERGAVLAEADYFATHANDPSLTRAQVTAEVTWQCHRRQPKVIDGPDDVDELVEVHGLTM